MPYIGTQPLTGQFKKLDAITVVNGQAAYTLNHNSAAYKPATVSYTHLTLPTNREV